MARQQMGALHVVWRKQLIAKEARGARAALSRASRAVIFVRRSPLRGKPQLAAVRAARAGERHGVRITHGFPRPLIRTYGELENRVNREGARSTPKPLVEDGGTRSPQGNLDIDDQTSDRDRTSKRTNTPILITIARDARSSRRL